MSDPSLNLAEMKRSPATRIATPLTADQSAVGEEIDLLALLRGLMDDWIMIVCLTAILGGIGLIYASFSQRLYEVVAILEPSLPGQPNTNLGNLPGGPLGAAALSFMGVRPEVSAKDEAVAYLKSRALEVLFIDHENLMPELFPELWDTAAKTWKHDGNPPPVIDGGLKILDGLRTITLDDQTGLVRFQLHWPDRFRAAELASATIALANAELRQRAIADANSIINRAQQQLSQSTNAEVRASLTEMLEDQVKVVNLAQALDQYAFKIIDPPAVPGENYFVWPKRRIIVGFALGAGFVLGVIVSLFRTVLSVRDAPSARPLILQPAPDALR